jgi:hypothetical protein
MRFSSGVNGSCSSTTAPPADDAFERLGGGRRVEVILDRHEIDAVGPANPAEPASQRGWEYWCKRAGVA